MKVYNIAAIALLSTCTSQAFTLTNNKATNVPANTLTVTRATRSSTPYFMEEVVPKVSESSVEMNKKVLTNIQNKKTPPKKSVGGAKHKEGVFSPVVQVAKAALGEDKLNKIRGKVIGVHSDIISSFVETHDSVLGNAVIKHIYGLFDENKDGKLDANELRSAFETFGFSWLQEKQVDGIVKRAGGENGYLVFDQFKQEFPKTLRTNLVKLAKKNGAEMGLLV